MSGNDANLREENQSRQVTQHPHLLQGRSNPAGRPRQDLTTTQPTMASGSSAISSSMQADAYAKSFRPLIKQLGRQTSGRQAAIVQLLLDASNQPAGGSMRLAQPGLYIASWEAELKFNERTENGVVGFAVAPADDSLQLGDLFFKPEGSDAERIASKPDELDQAMRAGDADAALAAVKARATGTDQILDYAEFASFAEKLKIRGKSLKDFSSASKLSDRDQNRLLLELSEASHATVEAINRVLKRDFVKSPAITALPEFDYELLAKARSTLGPAGPKRQYTRLLTLTNALNSRTVSLESVWSGARGERTAELDRTFSQVVEATKTPNTTLKNFWIEPYVPSRYLAHLKNDEHYLIAFRFLSRPDVDFSTKKVAAYVTFLEAAPNTLSRDQFAALDRKVQAKIEEIRNQNEAALCDSVKELVRTFVSELRSRQSRPLVESHPAT